MDPYFNKRKFDDGEDEDNEDKNSDQNKKFKLDENKSDDDEEDNYDWEDDGIILGEVPPENNENQHETKAVDDVNLIEDEEIKKLVEKPSLMIVGSLQNINSTSLNTHSNIGSSAFFAVWNLWDFGGGFQAAHWKKNGALEKLPNEIIGIKADVIGFLEIKTGGTQPQLPKDKPKTTAFEMGALLGWMIDKYLTDKKLFSDNNINSTSYETILDQLSNLIWVGEHSESLLNGLKYKKKLNNHVHLTMVNEIVEDLIKSSNDHLSELIENHLPNEPFYFVGDACENSNIGNSWFKTKAQSNIDEVQEKEMINRLTTTWNRVITAFEYGGTIIIEKEVAKNTKAEGIPNIKIVFETLKKESEFESVIIDPVEGDGETTAFVYNKNKFCLLQKGSISIRRKGFSFRSAGFLFLQGISGTLNNKNILAVAWHAPSELHRGNRKEGYECFNEKIQKMIGNRDIEVVMLADMNLREENFDDERHIKENVYENWLPKLNLHKSFKTSLKLEGNNGSQWNHPFDKVLLLQRKNQELEILNPEKMPDNRSAKEIRVFSDHSWVRAEIIPKKTNK